MSNEIKNWTDLPVSDRGGQPECSKQCSEMHTEADANCVIWRSRQQPDQSSWTEPS